MVISYFLCHTVRGGWVRGRTWRRVPQPQNRLTWLCCFCRRRRNAIFSAVILLDSSVVGMWLFCNFSANIHRKRRGVEGGRCSCFLSSYFVQRGWEDCPLTPGPPPIGQPRDLRSHGQQWQRWEFHPSQQNIKACNFSSGLHILRVQGL